MLAEIAIFPTDKGESVSKYVVKAVRYIHKECERKGMKYETTSMATLIEGEFNDVYDVIIGAHKIIRANSNRVHVDIRIDDRKRMADALTYKRERIEDRLRK